jgi:hypothetical protein
MKETMKVRLSTAAVGGEQLIRATALDHKKQMFFQAPTEEQAINGLKSKLADYEERRAVRAEYPKTVEVAL